MKMLTKDRIVALVVFMAGGQAWAQIPPSEVLPSKCPGDNLVEGFAREDGGNACGTRRGGNYGDYLYRDEVESSLEIHQGPAPGDFSGDPLSRAKNRAFQMANEKCSRINAFSSAVPVGNFTIWETCGTSGYGRERSLIKVSRIYRCQHQW